MYQSILAVFIPPEWWGIFPSYQPGRVAGGGGGKGDRALVLTGAFDAHVIFTSQHCYLLSMRTASAKNKFGIGCD